MINVQLARPIEILLVEDNPGDVVLAREAFSDAKIANHISVVRDGEQALDYLKRKGEYTTAMRPDLILLDLNLPKKSGREVLEGIKESADLKRIPVVIMTSSKEESDIVKSYNLHANSYIVKPLNLAAFATIVQTIENFWFTVVMLPSAP